MTTLTQNLFSLGGIQDVPKLSLMLQLDDINVELTKRQLGDMQRIRGLISSRKVLFCFGLFCFGKFKFKKCRFITDTR